MKMPKSSARERALLACGLFVAPVFYVFAIVQLLIRPDFDIRVQPISFLSLGELGWIQVLSFIITGALAIFCAWGLRTYLQGQRGGTWGPVLVGLFGIGMILAGIFRPDPLPVEGSTPSMTVSGMLHMIAFFVAFPSLIAACFVFMRRFIALKQTGFAVYCAATAVAVPVLMGASAAQPAWVGVIVAGAGLVLFGWLAVLSWRLLSEARVLS